MVKHQVFISHSSNRVPATLTDAGARQRLERAIEVRDAVAVRLETEFDVWLDRRRLRAGALWRLEIFEALYRCSAAVILLDDDAFASHWVLQEATILNFRSKLSPGFVLIPVLLDEGSSNRFDQGPWRPLALREVMALKDSPASIADEVADRLANLAESCLDKDLERWVTTLAGNLRQAARSQPERFTEACEELALRAPDDWAAGNAAATAPFARALLSASPDAVAKIANLHLKQALPQGDDRRSIARHLRPIWVNLTAAGCTAVALQQPPAERRIALNTVDADAAADYLDRAVNCSNILVPIRSADVFGEDADELYRQLEQLVIDRCPEIRRNPSAEGFARWLSRQGWWRPVLFIRASLPPSELGDLLDRLSSRFPGITLFILSDGHTDDELTALGATVIQPPLDPEDADDVDLYRVALTRFMGD